MNVDEYGRPVDKVRVARIRVLAGDLDELAEGAHRRSAAVRHDDIGMAAWERGTADAWELAAKWIREVLSDDT